MKYKIFTALTLFLLMLTACANQPYLKENSAFILFKTNSFKYADMGFIYENSSEIKVEIYGSGQALMSLTISDNSVCMSLLACMSKKEFNEQVLASTYPKDILNNIFRSKTIFNAKNVIKTSNGFKQKIIKKNRYNIDYSVSGRETIFRDKVNNILIKVKKQ